MMQAVHVDPATTVADLVTEAPLRAAIFEQLGIDYCCGGAVSLVDVCAARGLDLDEVVRSLDEATASVPDESDWAGASIEDIITNIVDVHHAYLRDELPRISMLAHKVARAHGGANQNLVEAQDEVDALVDELGVHLAVEEDSMFPVCLRIARGDVDAGQDLDGLVSTLVHDHDQVGGHLASLRALLKDFVPPTGACTSYRAYLDAVSRLEQDTHRHLHKENHILFPRVEELAAARQLT